MFRLRVAWKERGVLSLCWSLLVTDLIAWGMSRCQGLSCVSECLRGLGATFVIVATNRKQPFLVGQQPWCGQTCPHVTRPPCSQRGPKTRQKLSSMGPCRPPLPSPCLQIHDNIPYPRVSRGHQAAGIDPPRDFPMGEIQSCLSATAILLATSCMCVHVCMCTGNSAIFCRLQLGNTVFLPCQHTPQSNTAHDPIPRPDDQTSFPLGPQAHCVVAFCLHFCKMI